MQIAVVIPVYGEHHLTDAVMADLLRERDLMIPVLVDNQGDYAHQDATVLRPGSNLRAVRGLNYGVRHVLESGLEPDYICLLNNDVRLSAGFLQSLVEASGATGALMVGPLYDGPHWQQNRGDGTRLQSDVQAFTPRAEEWEVAFMDGTCMFLPLSTWRGIGELDEEHFGGEYGGWGVDFDYAMRIRAAGGFTAVTARAYMHHLHQATAKKVAERLEIDWDDESAKEMESGMSAKYGPDWRNLLHGLGDVDPNSLPDGERRERFANGWW